MYVQKTPQFAIYVLFATYLQMMITLYCTMYMYMYNVHNWKTHINRTGRLGVIWGHSSVIMNMLSGFR